MGLWYRITKKQYKNKAFNGDGGLYASGRWNHKGVKVVYCSSSISLAALEWLSHQGVKVIGTDWVKFSIDIPDSEIAIFRSQQLPNGWDRIPDSNISRDFATKNLFESDRLAIAVPSVVIPEEMNLIVNPNHSLMPSLKITYVGINKFNSRLAASE